MNGSWHGGKGDAKRPEGEAGAYARGYDAIKWSARDGEAVPEEPTQASEPVKPDPGIGGFLAALGELIRTQDNRITESPIFVVEQKTKVCGLDDGYADHFEWYDPDACESYDDAGKAERDAERAEAGSKPIKWRRVGYVERWEFVTACFTEQGAKDYLSANGHNLREPRIYVHSGWRNAEWKRLRAFFMECKPATGDLAAAAREVLSHRIGEQPTQGWLRDNDRSRTALTALATALAFPEKPHTGTVADYPDDHLLERAVRNIARRRTQRKEPAWCRVMDAFGLGSTYSAQLCRRFGIDPETGKDITDG